jgi:hypothetical protein
MPPKISFRAISQKIQRTSDLIQSLFRDMRIYLSGLWIAMPQQDLDVPKVRTIFKQMCRKSVTQRMYRRIRIYA